jgi:multidrug efflux pump subunit AcrA (membrane-fusion protein)
MANWMRYLGWLPLALLLAGCEAQAPVEQPKKEAKEKVDKAVGPAAKDAAARKPTHKVEKGPFKVEVTCKGIVESSEMTEVVLRSEAWTQLTVLKAVEPGTRVQKGDPLVTMDFQKIDEAIRDLEASRNLAELAIRQTQEDLHILDKSVPLDLAAAERAKKVADEDLAQFLELDRPFAEKSAHFWVKSASNWLEYAKEELRQLEKMYKANDLTEGTEEIILKRQRDWVESATFYLKMAEFERDQVLKVTLPRREVSLTENARKQTVAWDKARNTLPLLLNQKRLDLEKLTYERSKATQRLEALRKDRDAMAVKAPAEGIVFYGKCVRGNWTTASTMEQALSTGMLAPNQVFLTIVKPRPIFVRAVVEEKDLRHVRPGMTGKAVLVADADLKLPVTLERVSAVPVTPGNFDARLALDLGQETAALMPGMACTVKFVPYQKAEALAVPASAVFSEELDEDSHYVYLAGKDGKPEKRPVTIGKKSATKTEILKGLQEGDEILLEKPSEPKLEKPSEPKKADVPGKTGAP